MSRPKAINAATVPELTRYQAELPEAAELARIAAIFLASPNAQHHDGAVQDAIQKAARLYLACADFCATYNVASPKDRATNCGDTKTALLAAATTFASGLAAARRKDGIPVQPHEITVPPLTHVPATLDDFVKQVIKARTPSDGLKRLRDYFRSLCPEGQDVEKFASEGIKRIRQVGFTYDNVHDWDQLGRACLAWWANEVSKKYRNNRKGKTKGKATSEA